MSLKNLAAIALIGCALASNADTRLIEGRGIAKNRENQTSAFAVRVTQSNNNPAQGRLEMSWQRGDTKVTIVTEQPRMVTVREREGRMQGPARVTVQRGNDRRTWEGVVHFTAWDARRNNVGRPDKVRVRFIRDPWGPPEGDFFYEGVVVEGDVAVLSR